jgi:hypothetical protein
MVVSVTLTNVIVTNNVARFAGVINAVGNLTLINSTISNNVACGPGGISSGNGVLTLTNSAVSGNINTYGNSDDSGGIRNGNALTIAYSTIAGNTNPGISAGITNRAPGTATIQRIPARITMASSCSMATVPTAPTSLTR